MSGYKKKELRGGIIRKGIFLSPAVRVIESAPVVYDFLLRLMDAGGAEHPRHRFKSTIPSWTTKTDITTAITAPKPHKILIMTINPHGSVSSCVPNGKKPRDVKIILAATIRSIGRKM